MKRHTPKVKILAPDIPARHITGCSIGQYIRFAASDTQSNARWNMQSAYQYVGNVGASASKYAKVIPVLGGVMFQVPHKTQVVRLNLVSIELQPEEPS